MKLREKLLAVLVPIVVGYGAVDHLAQRRVIGPSFTELEGERATADALRSIGAIEGEIERIRDRARGLASRSSMADLVLGRDDRAIEAQLGEELYADERFDLVYVCDAEGRRLWGGVRAPHTREPLQLRDFPDDGLKPGHVVLTHRVPSAGIDDPLGDVHGLLETDAGPLLIASVAVSEADRSLGRVVLGRFLTPDLVASIAERARIEFATLPIAAVRRDELTPELAQVIDSATGTLRPVVQPIDSELLQAHVTFDDVRHRPALLITTDVQREISQRGGVAMRYALGSTLAAGLLLLLSLSRLIQRIVIQPVTALTEHALRVGRSDDTTVRLGLQRDDEVGVLAGEFDAMLDKLEKSRIALVETARTAGMSEIATGILHNVGNTLNSVGVASKMVEKGVTELQVEGLDKVVGMLEAHADDLSVFISEDPRGQKLVPLLRALSERLAQGRRRTQEELVGLAEGLEHIRSLVASQQEFATRTTVVQVCRISDLLDKAVEITEQASNEDTSLIIERDFADLPGFPTDRSKLLGLLVNLVQNARQAIERRSPETPTLRLHLTGHSVGGLRIEVTDNGEGIAPDNLETIFEHGFTTKSDGHGFGLHSAANSAVELGGSLTATSGGSGQGATFVLELTPPDPLVADLDQAA